MTPVLIPLHIANTLLCLLLALHFCSTPARRKWPLWILTANYLLYANQSLLLSMQLSGVTSPLLLLRPLGAMLIAPALYLYFLALVRPDARLRRSDAWHLLPAAVMFAASLTYSPLLAFLDITLFILYAAYLLLIFTKLCTGQPLLAHLGADAAVAFRYLCTITLLLTINLLVEIVIFLEMFDGTALIDTRTMLPGAVLLLLIHAATVFFALQRSRYLEWMYTIGEQGNPAERPARLEPVVAERIFQQWLDLIEREALFQQEFGITLSQAAKKLQIPARQLSNAVNQVYGQTFSVHLNDRRIAHAKELLLSQPELSIIDVMYQSGFSSKSNFNKEFARVTGTTPGKFRELH